VKLVRDGETYEGAGSATSIVTSPENLARLDRIQSDIGPSFRPAPMPSFVQAAG